MWSERYRPKAIEEMVGNEEARLAIALWLKKWKPGAKAMLIVGPPGTGKTTLVTLLAKETGINIIELNASDVRTKDKLDKKIGEATKTVSLFGERMLIFLDEVDGLLGRADYGGVEFIKEVVKETQNPIIMAANDQDADEIRKLAAVSVFVRFKPPPPREVEMYLRRIAESEGLPTSDEVIRDSVRVAGGDLRQAINALQSRGEARSAPSKDVSISVSEALNSFFSASDKGSALEALRKVSLQPPEKIRAIHLSLLRSGLPPDRMAEALEVLSRADVLMGKIMKSQQWRILRYLDALLAQELHPVIRELGVRYTTEDLPFPTLLRIWNDSKKVKEISRRYAVLSHTGGGSARSQDLPYIFALSSDKEFRHAMERALDLDETFEKFLQKEASR